MFCRRGSLSDRRDRSPDGVCSELERQGPRKSSKGGRAVAAVTEGHPSRGPGARSSAG